MSDRRYTWEKIELAIPSWIRQLGNEPSLSPVSYQGMQLLRRELNSGPHWIVDGRLSLEDPLGQRVTVYWSDHPGEVLSLIRPGVSEKQNREGMEELLDVLQRNFPHGPARFPSLEDED